MHYTTRFLEEFATAYRVHSLNFIIATSPCHSHIISCNISKLQAFSKLFLFWIGDVLHRQVKAILFHNSQGPVNTLLHCFKFNWKFIPLKLILPKNIRSISIFTIRLVFKFRGPGPENRLLATLYLDRGGRSSSLFRSADRVPKPLLVF